VRLRRVASYKIRRRHPERSARTGARSRDQHTLVGGLIRAYVVDFRSPGTSGAGAVPSTSAASRPLLGMTSRGKFGLRKLARPRLRLRMGGVIPGPRSPLVTVTAVVVIVGCLAALTWYTWPIHRYVLQIFAIAAVLVALHTAPPISRWLERTPVPHRAALYLLLALVVAGHFTLQQKKYFPFVVWDIFSSVSDQETVFCRELIGKTASEKQVRLLVEQLYPSIIQFERLEDIGPEKMNRLVAALVKTYNAQHPTDQLREVDLMLMAVKVHLPPGETRSQPSCELLQRFDLSQTPSS